MPENVVFILGAGASKPYGLPTAAELRAEILTDGQVPLAQGVPAGESQFAKALIEDLKAQFATCPESIDRFLELNPGLESRGKRLIANALLLKEIGAVCRASIATDWYAWYFRQIHLPQSRSIHTANQTIITFNYDNTLEWALHVMVQGTFGLDADTAMSRVKPLPIIHVYGRLEMSYELNRWLPKATGNFRYAVEESASGIQIVSRGKMGDSDELKSARAAIQDATKIVFLGFGFDPVNLERLGLDSVVDPTRPRAKAEVLACVFGLRGSSRESVRQRLSNLRLGRLPRPLVLGEPDQGCEEFLRENVDLRSWLDITEQ